MVNKILHLLLLPLCASVCQRDNSKSWRQIFMNFFGEAGPVTGNNSLDFGDDAHHEADSGIFLNGILQLRGGENCTNFTGSDTSAEVCGLRVL